MESNFKTQCIMGRQLALTHLQLVAETDNLPKFVQQIREAAINSSGQGIGYIFQLAEVAMFGHSQAISTE